jgi:hypothetical protein
MRSWGGSNPPSEDEKDKDMATFLWLLLVAGGPLLLGLAFAYGIARSRRLSPREREARHRAVEDAYNDNEISSGDRRG